MATVKLDVSEDKTRLKISLVEDAWAASSELSTQGIDELIRQLADARAKMTPVHSAEPPAESAQAHQGDNLLWSVRAVPEQLALEFATQHPGLGWTVMLFSRAQVEDLQTNIEFELLKLPERV